jgi:hypothetical protein
MCAAVVALWLEEHAWRLLTRGADQLFFILVVLRLKVKIVNKVLKSTLETQKRRKEINTKIIY